MAPTVTEFGGSPQCRQIREYLNGEQETVEYTIEGEGDPRTVKGMFDLPKKGDAHPTNPALRVVERTIERLSDSTCRAVLTYSREGFERGELEEVEIEWHMAAQEPTIHEDLDGNYLGEEGVDVYRPRVVLSITAYKSFFKHRNTYALIGTVNKATFMGEAGGLLGKFLYLGPEPARKVGTGKWQVQHEFLYNPFGHQHRRPLVLEQQVDTGEVDDEDNPVYETRRVVQKDADGNAIIEIVKVYEESNFNLLGLGL